MAKSSNLILPHENESEIQVLGGVLIDGKLIECADLYSDDFYSPKHQAIFSVMKKLQREKVAIDLSTVFDGIIEAGVSEMAGGSLYLTYLTELVSSTVTFSYHVDKVKKASHKRKIIEKAWKVVDSQGEEEVVRRFTEELNRLEAEKSIRFKPIPASQLPETNVVESLWGEIFYPRCITQINSEPGIGKTTLLYNICSHGAIERDFLDIPFQRRLKILYFDLETPDWLRNAKLARTVGDRLLLDNLHFLETLDLEEDFQHLLALCKRDEYDMVVFDTQSRALAMEKENDNSEANRMLFLMRRLTVETNCALVLVHHCGKTEDAKSVYKGRGASAIAGGVDVVINISALDDEILKITVGKNRIIGTNPVLYLKKAGEDIFEPYTPPGGESGFEVFSAQNFILSLSPERTWRTAEICDLGRAKGFTESTIKRSLSRLVESGKITKVKWGEYQIGDLYHCVNYPGLRLTQMTQ